MQTSGSFGVLLVAAFCAQAASCVDEGEGECGQGVECPGEFAGEAAGAAEPRPVGASGHGPAVSPTEPHLGRSRAAPDAPLPAPCLVANPGAVNFGGKSFGEQAVAPLELSACGAAPVELYSLAIKEGSHPHFEVYVGGWEARPWPEAPVVIPPGSTLNAHVSYIPAQESACDSKGLVLDTGTLLVSSNAATPEMEIPLSGAGVNLCCSTAVIGCLEGDDVQPGTTLHLFGDESVGGNCHIDTWEWIVSAPHGATGGFFPSAGAANPTFPVDVTGVYTFYLFVWDQIGTPSCYAQDYEVAVKPPQHVRIMLTWRAADQPNTSSCGWSPRSDMDLHLAHPNAGADDAQDVDGDGKPDPWFDKPFDCFWANKHPDWGAPGPKHDPEHQGDDKGSPGPEGILFAGPEAGVYKVGVHYWDDKERGSAYAYLRVYVSGQLVFDDSDAVLASGEMWEACTIHWPSGAVAPITDAGGQYKITPDYAETLPYKKW